MANEHKAKETNIKKVQWKQTSGFAADSTIVQIIVPETQVEAWDEEAEENNNPNRSDYLRKLIGEARAHRRNGIRGPRRAEQHIQELQSEVDRLHSQLDRERQKTGDRPSIDDVDFLGLTAIWIGRHRLKGDTR